MTPELTPLAEAVIDRATVTIVLDDGRRWTGLVREHATEPGLFTLHTGRRGRPPVFAEADVAEVIFE